MSRSLKPFLLTLLLVATAARTNAAPSADAGRTELGRQVARNLALAESAVKAARAQTGDLSENARAEFEAAASDVEIARRRLYRSLQAAQAASPYEWDSARMALAADYDSFTRAVARLQRIAATGTLTRSSTRAR